MLVRKREQAEHQISELQKLKEQQQSQLRLLADAVLKHHIYSCHWCPTDQNTCEIFNDISDGDEPTNCCSCPACVLARERLWR